MKTGLETGFQSTRKIHNFPVQTSFRYLKTGSETG